MKNPWKELQPHAVTMKMFSSVVVILLLLPVTVLAQQGTACMFNAPSGATVFGINFGHVGWGFQNDTTTWYFGATENGNQNFTVPAGGDTETWMSQGFDTDMYAAFKDAGNFHQASYYTVYRCISVLLVNVSSALAMQATTASDGYNVLDNNCLTKSVDILTSYGNVNLFYNGVGQAPNDYFNNLNLAGWGMEQAL